MHGRRHLVSHLYCFTACFLYHALYAFITLVMVHKWKGDTHITIGIAMMAGFMLTSLSYQQFQIVGWPAGLGLPQNAITVDAINVSSSPLMKDTIRTWPSYHLIHAMYVGTRDRTNLQHTLL